MKRRCRRPQPTNDHPAAARRRRPPQLPPSSVTTCPPRSYPRRVLSSFFVSGMAAASAYGAGLDAVVAAMKPAFAALYNVRRARAAELYQRAAALAAAGAPPDSLVVASLRLQEALALLSQEELMHSTAVVGGSSPAAWATVFEVAAILSGRADAGTLLPGTLRAEEQAYALAAVQVELRISSPDITAGSSIATKIVRHNAPLLGYNSALQTACLLLHRLRHVPSLPAADADVAHAFVLRAVTLIAQVGNVNCLATEAKFAADVEEVLEPARRVRGNQLDARFYDALSAAWRKPETIAALVAHGTPEELHPRNLDRHERSSDERWARDIAASGLRSCALPTCSAREVTVKQFKLCGGCRRVAYCCAEHSKAHWKEHKKTCARADTKQLQA